MMTWRKSAGILTMFLLFLSGCSKPQTFSLSPKYEAPIGKFSISIEAIGKIPNGADISDNYSADVKIESLDGETEISLFVKSGSPTVSYKINDSESGELPWNFRSSEASLSQILKEAGIKGVPGSEIDETVRVIKAACAGPKAVILNGQTTVLKVVKAGP